VSGEAGGLQRAPRKHRLDGTSASHAAWPRRAVPENHRLTDSATACAPCPSVCLSRAPRLPPPSLACLPPRLQVALESLKSGEDMWVLLGGAHLTDAKVKKVGQPLRRQWGGVACAMGPQGHLLVWHSRV
jgi:hypothetical protein